MKLFHIRLLPVLLLFQPAFGQQAPRNAQKYEVNTSLKATAPDATYPFLLVTDLTIPGCKPGAELAETQESIADAAGTQLRMLVTSVHAGAVLQECRRTDYYYVRDTADLRMVMETFYKDNFSEYQRSITIRPDPAWKMFLDTLLPAAR
ncbi:DUF695 domain-containing protein [Chitinophaga barathri]|uniref:DUF695 domain-containing protein n=1 Tax=Chitinophaga barathri TaxID=1647451 RepID=A0A3N4M893_9BACT|nr:DUF695 domain-containing protein [Chitinophaga barathri]RPD39814.1 DUF695 domain-containing protein [Chitinophaga barathri]